MRFLKKKIDIVNCDDAEPIVEFKLVVFDEFLSRDFGYFKPKTMLTLMEMATRFYSSKDAWLAKLKVHDGDPSTSDMKDEHQRSKHNCKNKHRNKDDDDDKFNAGFGTQGGDVGQKKRHWKGKKGHSSSPSVDKVIDRPCAYDQPLTVSDP